VSGLYDDEFVGFRVATDDEVNVALREAVVAVDTNVLLGLYRFLPQTANDVIKVLERIDDRLVVPNQVLREFWRHRQRSAGSPEAASRIAEDAIGKAAVSVKQALETWSKQVGLDAGERTDLLERVTGFAEDLREELAAVHARADARAGDEDSILTKLERLLDGRVTSALDDEQWTECVAEGHRRVEAEEPPGYRDAAKQEGDAPEGAAGDYLVWYQATRLAAERGCDLIIVTADEKDDWWWRQQAALLGPRPELSLEYHKLSGRRLFLLRPPELLARAATLDVEVDQQSLADADRGIEETDALAPWTADALLALLTRLDDEAAVQAQVIRLAAQSGGRVTRDQVYELGGFPRNRMLRGFTRPPLRVTAALQAEGVVPDHVLPILVARYPDGVKASYFSVPPEIPALYAELSVPQARPAHGTDVEPRRS
jgi:predicted nucleic acid-binding protein